jgi:hypothetical protein
VQLGDNLFANKLWIKHPAPVAESPQPDSLSGKEREAVLIPAGVTRE